MPMYITAAGQALEANAKLYNQALTLTHFVLGDGDLPAAIADVEAMTQLVNQVDQMAVNRLAIDEVNSNWLIIEAIVPPEAGPYEVAEVGILADDGTLYAVGSYPRTVKPKADSTTWGKELYIKATIATSNASLVTLQVDNTLVAATRDYAIEVASEALADAKTHTNDSLTAHQESRDHPDATATEFGLTRYATPAETRIGERGDRAATPAGVKSAVDTALGNQFDLASRKLVVINGALAMEEI